MPTDLQEVAAGVLKKRSGPLLLKEAAWRLIVFLVKCGRSNPVSFVLRPIVTHKKLRLAVGGGMAMAVVATAVVGPFPSWAADTGGKLEIVMLGAGDVDVVTAESAQVPIEHYRTSQGYHLFHPGVDLAAKIGEPVRPVSMGRVRSVKHDRVNYGNHVIVDHGNGEQTLYAHLSKINVEEGQMVTTEDVLGEVGSTGRSTGPHLHLEIRENGRAVNPASVIDVK